MPENRYRASLAEIFSSFWCHRDLIRQLTRRDVLEKYQGSVAGILWSFLHPLAMLGVYTLVFGGIFRNRYEYSTGGPAEFALVLFTGLITVNFFSESVNRSCALIVSRPNYVKKVVFPLEVLPWVIVGSALFHVMVSFAILLVFKALLGGTIEATALWLPVLYLPIILLVVGLCWLLSSLGVFIRDIGQTMTLVTSALLFLSPVFYSLSAVPENFRKFFYLNPVTFIVLQSRELLLLGHGPDWRGWMAYFTAGIFIFWAGFACFQKLRKGFADVL